MRCEALDIEAQDFAKARVSYRPFWNAHPLAEPAGCANGQSPRRLEWVAIELYPTGSGWSAEYDLGRLGRAECVLECNARILALLGEGGFLDGLRAKSFDHGFVVRHHTFWSGIWIKAEQSLEAAPTTHDGVGALREQIAILVV